MSKHCPKLQDVNYLKKRIILQRSHHEHLEIRNNVKFLANIRVWFQNDRCRVKFNDDAFFNQLYTHQTCQLATSIACVKKISYTRLVN